MCGETVGSKKILVVELKGDNLNVLNLKTVFGRISNVRNKKLLCCRGKANQPVY